MSRRPNVKSLVEKRSMVVGTRKTSVSIETAFWTGLKEIAASEDLTIRELVTRIDADREHNNLSSVIRLFVLEHYRRLAAPAGKGKQ